MVSVADSGHVIIGFEVKLVYLLKNIPYFKIFDLWEKRVGFRDFGFFVLLIPNCLSILILNNSNPRRCQQSLEIFVVLINTFFLLCQIFQVIIIEHNIMDHRPFANYGLIRNILQIRFIEFKKPLLNTDNILQSLKMCANTLTIAFSYMGKLFTEGLMTVWGHCWVLVSFLFVVDVRQNFGFYTTNDARVGFVMGVDLKGLEV